MTDYSGGEFINFPEAEALVSNSQLVEMFSHRDPVPPSLADEVLLAISMEDLDVEYQLLSLVEKTRELAGARQVTDALTVAFAAHGRSLMMRISPLADGRRRVDGWIGPASQVTVKLSRPTGAVECVTDETGRFELASIAAGPARVMIAEWPSQDGDENTPFATPLFDL